MDEDFAIFKRFDYLQVRCLLEQQDELQELECRLCECDAAETTSLYLSSRRMDRNTTRRELLKQIKENLGSYSTYTYLGRIFLATLLTMWCRSRCARVSSSQVIAAAQDEE